VGAFQFVFGDWKLMMEDGDRDKCYYNDFCYRVSGYDVSFNLMISNLAYMIAWVMEAEVLAWCNRLVRNSRTRACLPAGEVELPKHCIKCANIECHLAKMSVPHFRTNPDEAMALHAQRPINENTVSPSGTLLPGRCFLRVVFSTVPFLPN